MPETRGPILIREPGTLLEGITIDASGHRYGIKVEAADCTLRNVTVRNAQVYGIESWGDRLTVIGSKILHCGKTCFISWRATAQRILESELGHTDDEHAIYFSEGGEGHQAEGCYLHDAADCAIQANAVPMIAKAVRCWGNRIERCGNRAVQYAGVHGGIIGRNTIRDCRSPEVVLWHDDAGDRYWCKDVDCREQTEGRIDYGESTGILLPESGRPDTQAEPEDDVKTCKAHGVPRCPVCRAARQRTRRRREKKGR